MTKKILAIDQGSVKCGFAFLEGEQIQNSGFIKLKGDDRKERYRNLLEYLDNLVADEDIRYMAIEDVYQKRSKFNNPRTLKIMGETRGIITSVGIRFNLEIIDINPSSVTKYLGIKRGEDKKLKTREFAAELIGRDVTEDEADAIVIALIAKGLIDGKNE